MLDFKEIKDGTQFEIFVRELLIAYGLRAYWSGVGWCLVNIMLTATILLE